MTQQSMALGFALMEHMGPSALAGDRMSLIEAFELGWDARAQHVRKLVTTDHETKEQFVARVMAALDDRDTLTGELFGGE
jgi:hypothetical protein